MSWQSATPPLRQPSHRCGFLQLSSQLSAEITVGRSDPVLLAQVLPPALLPESGLGRWDLALLDIALYFSIGTKAVSRLPVFCGKDFSAYRNFSFVWLKWIKCSVTLAQQILYFFVVCKATRKCIGKYGMNKWLMRRRVNILQANWEECWL